MYFLTIVYPSNLSMQNCPSQVETTEPIPAYTYTDVTLNLVDTNDIKDDGSSTANKNNNISFHGIVIFLVGYILLSIIFV